MLVPQVAQESEDKMNERMSNVVGDAVLKARKQGTSLARAAREAYLAHASQEAFECIERMSRRGLEVRIGLGGDSGFSAEIIDYKHATSSEQFIARI